MKLNDFIEVMLEQMRKMDTEDEIRKVFKVKIEHRIRKNKYKHLAITITRPIDAKCVSYQNIRAIAKQKIPEEERAYINLDWSC